MYIEMLAIIDSGSIYKKVYTLRLFIALLEGFFFLMLFVASIDFCYVYLLCEGSNLTLHLTTIPLPKMRYIFFLSGHKRNRYIPSFPSLSPVPPFPHVRIFRG